MTQIFHREYIDSSYCKLLQKNSFENIKVVTYNMRLLPRPFDDWFPSSLVFISKNFEGLTRTFLWWLATGVNIEATKRT